MKWFDPKTGREVFPDPANKFSWIFKKIKKNNMVDFKETAVRWVAVNGGNCINVDIAPYFEPYNGPNKTKAISAVADKELMFITKKDCLKYIKDSKLFYYMPARIEIKYK